MPLFLRDTEPLRGVWRIEESAAELLSMLSRRDCLHLPPSRVERRRQEWLAVRVLLKELLGGEEAMIAYRADGAPYLPGMGLHISISHTKGFAAVALSGQSPAGIDIECPGGRIQRVRSRFMSAEEEEMIDANHEEEHLLVCWCAKETLFKLIGQRGVDFRKHLHILPFDYGESGRITARESCTPRAATYRLGYMVNRYFAMSWSLVMTEVKRPLLLNSTIMVLLSLMR
jgi:phosphopantetheinyl transferase